MRRVNIYAPFTRGMVTDEPPYRIGPQNSAFAQDGFSPSGVFRQRQGWKYDGTVADVAANLRGVYRVKFALTDVTRTVTCAPNGDIYIHNAAGAGSKIFTGAGVPYLPRAVYRDELLFCATDGLTPLVRWSGVAPFTTPNSAQGAFTLGEATYSSDYRSGSPPVGSYLVAGLATGGLTSFRMVYKVIETSSSSLLLDGVRASVNKDTYGGETTAPCGPTWPAVAVYEAGTVNIPDPVTHPEQLVGYGTKWLSGGFAFRGSSAFGTDGVLYVPTTGKSSFLLVNSVSSDTMLIVAGGGSLPTKSRYQVARCCPFKDVAVHRESLWGTGVVQYPDRVYVAPPAWNPSFPPGSPMPFDPILNGSESENANDFLLDSIDVPGPYDGDHNVALCASPNEMYVLKRGRAFSIYGAYGGLTVSPTPTGPGCIDIRSAQSLAEGAFWASKDTVVWAAGGAPIDLMSGKIAREWQALTNGFDYGVNDYCTLGVDSGYLIVHITTSGGTAQRTYLCDLRDRSWQSRISNVTSRFFFSSRVPGETSKLLFVSDDRQGRVMDLAPAINGTGTAKDAAGTGPRLQAWTTSAIAQASGIEGVTRMVDLHVHANVYDAGAAGATKLDVSLVSGGGVSNEADSTKALGTINSDNADRIDRAQYRPLRRGRLHQVRVDASTTGTDSNATKVEVHQIVATVRDGRSGA